MNAPAIEQIRRRLPEFKVDVMLVSAPPNVRYLTGFTGSNGLVMVWEGGAVLFTDPRYTIQASQQTGCRVRIVRGSLAAAAAKAIAAHRWRRAGFEAARMMYSDFAALRDALPLGASPKPLPPLVEQLRIIKSEAEIAAIRLSVITNSQALDATLPKIHAGMSEADVAAELEYQQRQFGAEKPAFETIVAAGARSALPHAEPGAQPLKPNQLLLIDMGACRNGYMSDMTRVFALGEPGRKLRRIYAAVLEAQLAAVDAVKPGVTAARVDRAARRVLEATGLGSAFVHSTGHGLGLEIHETPRLGRKDATSLRPGMVITIEPGAYIEGLGGVRIEDTVLVTEAGREPLTPNSKELISL